MSKPMSAALAGELVRVLARFTSIVLYPHYSGRFMFGRTCVGLSCESRRDLVPMLDAMMPEYRSEMRSLLESAYEDELGLERIFYFRGTTWPDAVSADAVC